MKLYARSLASFLSPADYGIQLLNRRSPFGFEVLASAQELPKYSLSVTEVDLTPSPEGHKPVVVELLVECSLVTDQSSGGPSKAKKQQGRASNMTTVLTLTSDLDFIDFRRIPYVFGQLFIVCADFPLRRTKALKNSKTFTVTALLTKPSQSVSVSITSVRSETALAESALSFAPGIYCGHYVVSDIQA